MHTTRRRLFPFRQMRQEPAPRQRPETVFLPAATFTIPARFLGATTPQLKWLSDTNSPESSITVLMPSKDRYTGSAIPPEADTVRLGFIDHNPSFQLGLKQVLPHRIKHDTGKYGFFHLLLTPGLAQQAPRQATISIKDELDRLLKITRELGRIKPEQVHGTIPNGLKPLLGQLETDTLTLLRNS